MAQRKTPFDWLPPPVTFFSNGEPQRPSTPAISTSSQQPSKSSNTSSNPQTWSAKPSSLTTVKSSQYSTSSKTKMVKEKITHRATYLFHKSHLFNEFFGHLKILLIPMLLPDSEPRRRNLLLSTKTRKHRRLDSRNAGKVRIDRRGGRVYQYQVYGADLWECFE